jgi:hypothetical protein
MAPPSVLGVLWTTVRRAPVTSLCRACQLAGLRAPEVLASAGTGTSGA